MPRTRACKFSSANPVNSRFSRYAETIGSISTIRKLSPIRSAESFASDFECSDEYFEGIEMPYTFLAPIASAAIAATSAESMPPDNPSAIDLKPFFCT